MSNLRLHATAAYSHTHTWCGNKESSDSPLKQQTPQIVSQSAHGVTPVVFNTNADAHTQLSSTFLSNTIQLNSTQKQIGVSALHTLQKAQQKAFTINAGLACACFIMHLHSIRVNSICIPTYALPRKQSHWQCTIIQVWSLFLEKEST